METKDNYIDSLILKGKDLLENPSTLNGVFQVDFFKHTAFFEWAKTSMLFLQTIYPLHPLTIDFQKELEYDKNKALLSTCQSLLGILKAFAEIKPKPYHEINPEILLSDILNNFCRYANQMRRKRHNNRKEFITEIKDEYDVQDLLHPILKLHFCNVSSEFVIPSDMQKSHRIDFYLDNHGIAIEVKRPSKKRDKNIIEAELKEDILSYSSFPDCKSIYCFIYDPEFIIDKPRFFEEALEKKSTNNFKIRAFIRPKE